MVLGRIVEGVTDTVEGVTDAVTAPFSDTVIRLGVTGLSRAGKTVFITSLVSNLLNRGRMQGLQGAASGAIRAAYLQPQPDDTVPRFAYETHLAAMTGPEPHWPDSTRSISELRLSLKVQPSGLIGTISGPRTVHLDIVDYPGEWLLDLALLDKSFADWSGETLDRIEPRKEAKAFLDLHGQTDAFAKLDEPTAQALASAFRDYLTTARGNGYSDCTPGRFLLPGDLEGSPALTFAPLAGARGGRGSLYREFERRFEAYKSRVVKPFFRDHFSRIDRQIVLVDALGAIHDGPAALEDMRRAMAEILGAFRPGQNAFLTRLFLGRRVERILFAATKADHLHHEQHGRLTAIMDALVAEAKSRADFSGASTSAMSIAALRATVEDQITHDGADLAVVQGTLLKTGKRAALFAGDLPENPDDLLTPARNGKTKWLDADFDVMRFQPAPSTLRPGSGPPHIRLDKATEFLIGDRLR